MWQCAPMWSARLKMWPLLLWLAMAYSPSRNHLDKVVAIPCGVLTSLKWWSNPGRVMAEVPFANPQPMILLISDAPDLGWGAHLGTMWELGPGGVCAAHKCQRAQCHLPNLRGLPPPVAGSSGASPDRQHGFHVLCEQARGRVLIGSLSGSHPSVGFLYPARNPHGGSTSPWCSQHTG